MSKGDPFKSFPSLFEFGNEKKKTKKERKESCSTPHHRRSLSHAAKENENLDQARLFCEGLLPLNEDHNSPAEPDLDMISKAIKKCGVTYTNDDIVNHFGQIKESTKDSDLSHLDTIIISDEEEEPTEPHKKKRVKNKISKETKKNDSENNTDQKEMLTKETVTNHNYFEVSNKKIRNVAILGLINAYKMNKQ